MVLDEFGSTTGICVSIFNLTLRCCYIMVFDDFGATTGICVSIYTLGLMPRLGG